MIGVFCDLVGIQVCNPDDALYRRWQLPTTNFPRHNLFKGVRNKPMSGKRKEYYPNNWQEYKDADDSDFIPHTFEEVMSWKVGGWELPSSVECIIRVTDLNTRKVTEHTYQRRSAAQSKVNQLIERGDVEFTVCDHESIHFIHPNYDN